MEDSNGFAFRFHYDVRGHLQQITDSAERQLPVETDAHGRIVAIHAPQPDPAATAGTVVLVRYAYDEAGDLTSVTDAEDHTTRFAYTSHLLTQETNRAGLSFYFEYEGSGPSARCRRTWGDGGIYDTKLRYDSATLTTVWDSLGHATAYTHQGGLVTTSVDAVEAVWQWTYNKYQELILERDALGQATSYDYDERGNQTQVTYPTGARVATQYNHQDLPELQTDANGDEEHRTYDEAGNLLTRTDAQGEAVEYVYSDGLLSGIDHRGIQLQYDGYFNLAHVVTADGRIRSLCYDVLGRLIKLTNAEGHVERRRYDLLGQLTWVRDADGSESTIAYDGEGNIIRAQDAQQEVEMAYVGLGQLARRRQAGTETVFHYDKEGRLTGLDNSLNQRYRFVLDLAGRVVEECGFENEVRRYAYDVAGRMITRQLPSGRSTQYRYNGTDQVTEVRYDDGTQEQYTYAPNGVLQEVRNEHALLQFTYNVQGQILTENQNEHSVMSTYDEAGQRVALHSSLGAEVYYGRDAYGRLAQVQAGAWSGLIKRDANGLELYRQLSGGLRTQWQRDAKGRPTRHQIVVQRQTSRQRRYHWQGADVLTEIEDSLSGRTRFTHDLFGALAATEYADGTQELRQPDAVGNLFRTTARTDCRYSPGGQLLEAKGTRYRYDADGNLIRKHTAAGQTWHYAWNAAGQLASVTLPSGYAVTFTYDALGRRLSKRYRGRVTHWVWDGDQPLHEWQELEVGPGRGAVQELTTWLFEDTTFAPMAKLQAGGAQSVVCDHLGTPLALYDAQGAVSWQAELDSYGAVRRGRGKPQDCPFRYQGQYEDTETGLYYNRFRYYDPETGQYISQDPIGLAGGGALHAYVADPLTQLDVFGLSEGSGTLANRMIKAGRTHGINPFVKNDFRAHHVIPHEVWTNNQDFFDDIGLGKQAPHARINRDGTRVHNPKGYDPKDSPANGVFLPKDEATGVNHKFDTYHAGGHPDTNADMNRQVRNISQRYDKGRGPLTKAQARKEISALQKAERKRLSRRSGMGCTQIP